MNNNVTDEKQLATGSIPKLFVKFAVPSVVSLMFLGIQSLIDGIILGNVAGAGALASVNIVLPCYTLISSVGIVMGIGCQTVVSVRLGQNDRRAANDALASAFIFLMGFSVAGSLLLWWFAPEMAHLLGADATLLDGSVAYIRSLVPFFPVLGAMFLTDYMLKAMARPVFAMSVMSGTVVMNIVLDLLFVGAWEMGTFGAGLATGLAFTSGAVVTVPVIFRKSSLLCVRAGRFYGRLVWRMFYNGSSEGLSELSSGITILLFNITIMKYMGPDGVAAFTAINYVLFMGITLFLGITDGIIPLISYNLGAGRRDRIRSVLRLAVQTNFIIGAGLFLTLLLAGEQVVSIFFRSGETAVLQIAASGTHIYAFAFLLNGLNILASGYFTAMTDARTSIVVSMLRGLVFLSAGILIYPRIWGVEGVWYAVPVAELLTFAVAFLLVRRSLKRKAAVRV